MINRSTVCCLRRTASSVLLATRRWSGISAWPSIFPRTGGQFVEVSLPRVGEAPISVSDYGDGWIDLLIRNVGKVTSALFTLKEGDNVWLRGCYGNGYPVDTLRHKPYWLSQAVRASRR